MRARIGFALLFLTTAAMAQSVGYGDAVVVGVPSPGFCGCMPRNVYAEVFGSSLRFERTLWQRDLGKQSSALAFARNGDLYSAENEAGYRIVRYDAAGNRIGSFGDTFTNPVSAIAFDTRGDLVVAQLPLDPAALDHALIVLDANGTRIASIDLPGIGGVTDVDVDADGCTVFVATERGIGTTSLCSAEPRFSPLPSAPTGWYVAVRIRPDGNLLTTFAQRTVLLDRDGRTVRVIDPDEALLHMTLDPVGNSFVAIRDAQVVRVDADGALAADVAMPHGSVTTTAVAIRGEWRAATSPPPPHHRAASK